MPSAFAGYVTVDLSPYVNLGFQNPNTWFLNGSEFAPIVGTTTGNQGSAVPFQCAGSLGNGGNNNFWFGLYGGPLDTLFGSPLTITIPINVAGVTLIAPLPGLGWFAMRHRRTV